MYLELLHIPGNASGVPNHCLTSCGFLGRGWVFLVVLVFLVIFGGFYAFFGDCWRFLVALGRLFLGPSWDRFGTDLGPIVGPIWDRFGTRISRILGFSASQKWPKDGFTDLGPTWHRLGTDLAPI